MKDKRQRYDNSEMVDLILTNPLKDVRVLKTTDASTLIIKEGNLISSFNYPKMIDEVDVFNLKYFDLTGASSANLFKAAIAKIKTDKERQVVEEVKAISYEEDNVLAWVIVKKKKTPLSLTDLPEFKLFLEQTDEASARSIILWIGSLMDPESNRRQYLHLWGSGEEGKSTLTEALTKAFNGQTVNVTARQLQSTHFGTELEGKRLYMFNDENNTSFFSSGPFKHITGDSSMDVNEKYQAVRSIKLTGKTIICSNAKMELTNSKADSSRAISIELTGKDKPHTWKAGFLDKAVEMVLFCYQEYKKALILSPELRQHLPSNKDNIKAAVERKLTAIIDIYNDNFCFEKGSLLKRSEVMEVFMGCLQRERPAIIRKQVAEYLEVLEIYPKLRNGYWMYENIAFKEKE